MKTLPRRLDILQPSVAKSFGLRRRSAAFEHWRQPNAQQSSKKENGPSAIPSPNGNRAGLRTRTCNHIAETVSAHRLSATNTLAQPFQSQYPTRYSKPI